MRNWKNEIQTLGNSVTDLTSRLASAEARVALLENENALLKQKHDDLNEVVRQLLDEAGYVADMKSYNEGIQNIMNYSLDVAMGKDK